MAEKRIVLSGNYCGGEPFDEILDIMEQRLAEKPELKIVILMSPRMVQLSNLGRIERLKMQHPDRFQVVTCGERWMNTSSTLYKRVTNHTKALVVDGKHCVMGGSGIQERWSYSDGVGEKVPYAKKSKLKLDGAMLAEQFRDMDFLFSGEKAGKELDEELLKLARIWENYNSAEAKEKTDIENTPVAQLLSEEPEPCTTTLPEDHLPKMVDTSDFQLYSQGPEMSHSAFMQRVISEIQAAERHIYIDHQYVHPTDEMMDLIADKVNQGVPLTVVTNGYESYSPIGHSVFGARNRSVRRQIYKKIRPENRHLFNWYEYGHGELNTPRATTLHSKVIVVDDTVLSGSSNLGFKSSVTCSDHEINFACKSREFAEQAIAAIESDAFRHQQEVHVDENGTPLRDGDGNIVRVPLSRRSENPEKITLTDRFIAKVHEKAAWLIG